MSAVIEQARTSLVTVESAQIAVTEAAQVVLLTTTDASVIVTTQQQIQLAQVSESTTITAQETQIMLATMATQGPVGAQGERGLQGDQGDRGDRGPQGLPGESWAESFETVSKNLRGKPFALNYTGAQLSSIIYNLSGGKSITKTLGYTGEKLTSITLSGDVPIGAATVKTFSYNGNALVGVGYS